MSLDMRVAIALSKFASIGRAPRRCAIRPRLVTNRYQPTAEYHSQKASSCSSALKHFFVAALASAGAWLVALSRFALSRLRGSTAMKVIITWQATLIIFRLFGTPARNLTLIAASAKTYSYQFDYEWLRPASAFRRQDHQSIIYCETQPLKRRHSQ